MTSNGEHRAGRSALGRAIEAIHSEQARHSDAESGGLETKINHLHPFTLSFIKRTMKVVLFCGGFGMRLREYSENIPKPLVCVGPRPVLWNVMRYYAHWGHKDFILCLGYKGDAIKEYFLGELDRGGVGAAGSRANGNACGATTVKYGDWRITFVDTGLQTNIGQRLLAVQPYLEAEDVFLANYSDGLTDLPLPRLVRMFDRHRAAAAFLAVRPQQAWHTAEIASDGAVRNIKPISDHDTWMNGGFFVFDRRIFESIKLGEELVEMPFQRLIARQESCALRYEGFWSCMDTYKDKQRLEDMVARGETPWEIWNRPQYDGGADDLEAVDGMPLLLKNIPR